MLTNQVRATLLATTAVLTLIASASAGPNLVLDPSFESGVFASGVWENTGGSLGNSLANVGGSAHIGSRVFSGGCSAIACVATGPTGVTGAGTISQTINLQPGIYQGSFFYRSVGGTPNSMAASLGKNVVVPLQVDTPTSPTYQQFSFISAASGGATPLVLGLRNSPGFDYIDDVRLELVDDGQGNNIAAAAQTVAVQASRDFLDRLQDRFSHAGSPIAMASVRETVLASNDGSYVNAGGKYRAFMSVFGSNGDWDDSDTSAHRRGLSAGFEFAAAQGLDLGVAFALSRTEFDTHTVFTLNSGEAHEYLGAIYAHWSPGSMPLYVNLIGGYGRSNNDFERVSLLGLGAAGAEDVKSTQWFGSAELGYDWAVSQKFTLTPFARVDTASVDQKGYSEVASGIFIPAVVAGRNFDSTRTILGAKAEANLDVGRRGLKLGGKVGWDHEFDRDRAVAFSETTGPVTFTGVGRAGRPDKDSIVAGAHAELPVSDDASLYAGYNGNYGDTERVHAGEVGLRVTW